LAKSAKFPLLSANTYLKASLKDPTGAPVEILQRGCVPKDPSTAVVWSGAERPEFLQPYVIRQAGSARVALIGIDNIDTGTTTTPENVSDYCFRDEAEAYLEVRKELEGKADIFVLVMHNGASVADALAKKLRFAGPDQLHAVFAGHTPRVERWSVGGGIPVVQSGANGEMFGRVDLVFDSASRKVNRAKTRAIAGARIRIDGCATPAAAFCQVEQATDGIQARLEGVVVKADALIASIIAAAKSELAPMANRLMGKTSGAITRERIRESALANALTDAFRKVSGTEIALMNTGGLRADFKAGDVTYEDLFRVLPFNNRGVVIAELSSERLMKLLRASVSTCGDYGALMQSGLKVVFSRDCSGPKPIAELLKVETVAGDVIFDRDAGIQPSPLRTFRVATLDFLAAGGSGYSDFLGAVVTEDLGIARELLVQQFLNEPAQMSPVLDGRWREIKPSAGN
jgi:5'-nucleotidase